MSGGQARSSMLKPKLGLFDATAISVGAIVGAGIFVVIGITAGLAGPALIISMIIAAAVSLVTAMSFAELTAWLPREGGVYEFARELLSPYVGFISGWMWMLANVFTGAAVSLGFAFYLVAVVPGISAPWLAAAICIAFTALNFIGVRQSAIVNNLLVVSKLSILAFFIVFGLFFVDAGNFKPFLPSPKGALYASVFIFFAFGGFARVAIVAEEVKEASKTVPRAIMLSLLISTVFYVMVGAVAVGLVGSHALSSSNSPLTVAMDKTGYSTAVYLVAVGGMLATASVLLTSVLGVSRVAFSMARRNDLPSVLSRVHARFSTPYYSIWLSGLLMAVMVLFVDLQKVVAVSTFAQLFYYGAANASAMKLRGVKRLYPQAVPVLGMISCAILLVVVLFASPQGWTIGVIGLMFGSALYLAMKSLHKRGISLQPHLK